MKKPAPKASAKTAATSTTPEGERIAKYLSRAGVASRREAERMIETGQVAVNGKVIDSPALNITPRDRITIDGKPVAPPEAARLWLYYKPEGLVTSASDEKGRDTVFDHLPEDLPRVMSIGRLDLNSEGLLLLTNDGGLKRRLELPSTGWLRKYRVRVKGNPTDPDLAPLRQGITVEGERFQPMEVVLDRHQGANAWLTVGLREGKNREIRRAMAEIGLTVNRLIRISYGPFRLNELQPGEVEEVRPKVLRDQLGLTGDDSDGAPARRVTRAVSRKSDDAEARRSTAPKTGAPKTGAPRTARSGAANATAPRWLDDTRPKAPRATGDGPDRGDRKAARPPRRGAEDAPQPRSADDRPARGGAPRPPRSAERPGGDGTTARRFGTAAAKRGAEDAPRSAGTSRPAPEKRAGTSAGLARPAEGAERAKTGRPGPKPIGPKSTGPKSTGPKPAGPKPSGGKPRGPRKG